MAEFDINQIPEEHKHTQHINPGTDATKEYICNDDDLGCLYDYMMAAMAGNDISELPRLWNQEIGVIRSRPYTPAHPPEVISKELALELCMDARKEAQQRIDEVIRKQAGDHHE